MVAGSGVSTDIWTCYAARIMVISVIPFLVVQLPQLLNSTSGRHLAVLIALILSLLMLISYCLYQVSCFQYYSFSLWNGDSMHVVDSLLPNMFTYEGAMN